MIGAQPHKYIVYWRIKEMFPIILFPLFLIAANAATHTVRCNFKYEPPFSKNQFASFHLVRQAMTILEGLTCLKFEAATHHSEYLFDVVYRPNSWCTVMHGTPKTLVLTSECATMDNIYHEMLHLFDFSHEQKKPERDHYIKVEQEDNFQNMRKYVDNDMFPFSFTSVLLYPEHAGLSPRWAFRNVFWPTFKFLSRRNILELNQKYCFDHGYVRNDYLIGDITIGLVTRLQNEQDMEQLVDVLSLFPHHHNLLNLMEDHLFGGHTTWVPKHGREESFRRYVFERSILLLGELESQNNATTPDTFGCHNGFCFKSTDEHEFGWTTTDGENPVSCNIISHCSKNWPLVRNVSLTPSNGTNPWRRDYLGDFGCYSGYCYVKCSKETWAWQKKLTYTTTINGNDTELPLIISRRQRCGLGCDEQNRQTVSRCFTHSQFIVDKAYRYTPI